MCDHVRRLLRGVCCVSADWSGLVAVVWEEDEAATGGEPSGMEV